MIPFSYLFGFGLPSRAKLLAEIGRQHEIIAGLHHDHYDLVQLYFREVERHRHIEDGQANDALEAANAINMRLNELVLALNRRLEAVEALAVDAAKRNHKRG